MKLLIEVLQELGSMFWADAGLCLGALGVVAAIGVAHANGWLGDLASAVGLGGGIVIVLLLSVVHASRGR